MLAFLFKSSAILAIFYLFYLLFLRKETYFTTIRWFFLAGLLFSTVLPFVVFTRYVEAVPNEIQDLQALSTAAVSESLGTNLDNTFDVAQIFMYGYVAGVLLLTLQFLAQLGSLTLLLLKHPVRKEAGYFFIETNTSVSPFSFFNFIVYNPNQFADEELQQILIHEKTHVKQFHSIDTILIHMFSIFQWFNPFVWLYKQKLGQNLEFITDRITEQHVSCSTDYQKLLLKTSISKHQFALVNNFYNSLLKKRILMLHKERSTAISQWKLAFIFPFLLLFLMLFNTEVVAQTNEDDTEIIKIRSEVIELIIGTKASKDELQKIKDKFEEKGLKISFSNIKRNSSDEITAIKIDAKARNGKAAASYAADDDSPIKPVKISYDAQNNNLSIGSAHSSGHKYRFKTQGSNRIIVKKDGKGHTEDVIHIETDSDDDSNTSVNVWTSKDGKHTKVKKSKEVIIEIDDDGNEVEKEIIKVRRSGSGSSDDIFIIEDDDDDTQTIYYVNGKKISKEALKKMDKKKIKTIEVKKERKKKKN